MKTCKLYKYYNLPGRGEVLGFVKLNDEIMDVYTIEAANGFEIREDSYGVPYIVESETQIPYGIATATMHDNGNITAPVFRLNDSGEIVTGNGRRTIAKVV